MRHTPEQAAVIREETGNILVSAAAGSGKTSVLTDRIVQRILDEKLDIRQVLVMTFTDAAARQMKEKIENKLQAALSCENTAEKHRRINRQLSFLPGASISTIHAFCLDVINNFYNYARSEDGRPLVVPGFSVDDGRESGLLLKQALDEYVNRIYEQIDWANGQFGNIKPGGSAEQSCDAWPTDRQAAFFRLVDGYGDRRGDGTVREQVLSIYRFMRSLPDYKLFIKKRLGELREASHDFSQSPHCRALVDMLALRLDHAMEAVPEMQKMLEAGIRFVSDAGRNKGCCRQYGQIIKDLSHLNSYLSNGGCDWETIRQTANGLADLDLPRSSRGDSPDKQRFMELFRDAMAEAVYFLSGSCGTAKYLPGFLFEPRVIFNRSAREIESELDAMLPSVELLFEMVMGLDQAYSEKKQAAGMIDFNDFEHLALEILRQEEVIQYYRRRFLEIYVDEYQDTSSIQEAIIQAVSQDNCLMVGDIKQSIYRFRHARPRIFLDKKQAYENGKAGCLHELNRNFRSVPGILDAVNSAFSQLMSTGAGEIEYDDSQMLKAHREGDPSVPSPVGLILVNRLEVPDQLLPDNTAGEEEPGLPDEAALAAELSRDRQEALGVVGKIYSLAEQGYRWQDMVILTRTRATGRCYREQLGLYGIPAKMPAEERVPDLPVMRQVEALIHLLDNSRQDIPLAAVMRSGIYQGGFTIEEMAKIRIESKQAHAKQVFYHEAARYYAKRGSDPLLRKKLDGFFQWLESLRAREQVLRLGELVDVVYEESGWLSRLAGMPDGAAQIRCLGQIRQWSERFERYRQRGIYAFARYLENLREGGLAESSPGVEPICENVVRILTIHGSKGLEFPVVFLAGTGYGLHSKDSRDGILISENLGIGMDYADPESQVRYPSHLKLAMLEEIKASAAAEEMRLLYVAMTRATDRLYIAGTVRLEAGKGDSRLMNVVQHAKKYGREKLPAHLVLSARNYLEWLIMSWTRQPGINTAWIENGLSADYTDISGSITTEVKQLPLLISQVSSKLSSDKPETDGTSTSLLLDDGLPELPYRYAPAENMPAKVTVSELKRQSQAWSETVGDEAPVPPLDLLAGKTKSTGQAFLHGISLMMRNDLVLPAGSDDGRSEDKQTAARLGTLLHTFLQMLDLREARRHPEIGELMRQMKAMRQNDMLNEENSRQIEPFLPSILDFVRSGLACEMDEALGGSPQRLYQEIPFTLAVPAADIFPDLTGPVCGDLVMVQGMIDCWFENENGITLVDFKSDHLPDDPALCEKMLRQRYGLQMAYYARAIRAATGRPVNRRLIWLIRQSRAYEWPS